MSETVLSYTAAGLVELMGYEIDELDERRMRLERAARHDGDSDTLHEFVSRQVDPWQERIADNSDVATHGLLGMLPTINQRMVEVLSEQSLQHEMGVSIEDEDSRRILGETYLYWHDQLKDVAEVLLYESR